MDIAVAAGLTVGDVVQGGTMFSMSWSVFSPQLNGSSNIENQVRNMPKDLGEINSS